jgi:2-iminobutanoate/2-iminopropanoate deaminase
VAQRLPIHTDQAPAAVGPYSQAIGTADYLWLSGQVALDPATGRLVEGGIEVQTRQVLENLGAVLAEGRSGFDRVVKATVYLVDMADFEGMNRVYAEFFPAPSPARVTVAVVGLPKGARVEIDAVALR